MLREGILRGTVGGEDIAQNTAEKPQGGAFKGDIIITRAQAGVSIEGGIMSTVRGLRPRVLLNK